MRNPGCASCAQQPRLDKPPHPGKMPGRTSVARLISMSRFMIPQINQTSEVQYLYLKFLKALQQKGFSGDINLDYANRTVLATDNSIYQVLPQGAVFPRNVDDLVILAHL